jgi:putative hydrolase of the HAD superfamily
VIGSNFDARLRPVVAGLPELAPIAHELVISSEVGYRKPHPGFYRAACDRLGLPPGRVLAVGDDVTNDLEGPRRAGLAAILIDREGSSAPTLAASCLPDLAALADLACADNGSRPILGKLGGASR